MKYNIIKGYIIGEKIYIFGATEGCDPTKIILVFGPLRFSVLFLQSTSSHRILVEHTHIYSQNRYRNFTSDCT